MNLYNFHTTPESLDGFDIIDMTVPSEIWHKYKNKPIELMKRESAIAKSPEYAYEYAKEIIHSPFPLGEKAIACDDYYALAYSEYVLKGPFPQGEKILSTNAYTSYIYAVRVLHGRFLLGEPTMMSDQKFKKMYNAFIKKLK